MYKLSEFGVIRISDQAWVPEEPENIDWQEYLRWLGLGNIPQAQFTPEEIASRELAVRFSAEAEWRETEMSFIADQLLGIEDQDPSVLPGTAKQWRDYRIKVRAWVEGATQFPSMAHRPTRPE